MCISISTCIFTEVHFSGQPESIREKCLTAQDKWMFCQEQRFLSSICEALHLYHLLSKRCKWGVEAKNQNSHQIHGKGFGSFTVGMKYKSLFIKISIEVDEHYIQHPMCKKDRNIIEGKTILAKLWTNAILVPFSLLFFRTSTATVAMVASTLFPV